jgi:hypothetical protein
MQKGTIDALLCCIYFFAAAGKQQFPAIEPASGSYLFGERAWPRKRSAGIAWLKSRLVAERTPLTTQIGPLLQSGLDISVIALW